MQQSGGGRGGPELDLLAQCCGQPGELPATRAALQQLPDTTSTAASRQQHFNGESNRY